MNYATKVVGELKDTVNQYMIASNGAIIKDNIKDEYMLKNYFDEIDAIKIIESSRKR